MKSTRLAKTAFSYALVMLITLASSTASAQLDAGAIDTGISDAAATAPVLSATDFTFFIERYDTPTATWVTLNLTEQTFFFDRARCECAGDSSTLTGSVRIAIQPSAVAAEKIRALLTANGLSTGTARLYAGSDIVNCLLATGTTASAYCLNLLDPSSETAGISGGMAVLATERVWESPPIPVAWLFGAAQTPVCNSPQSCDQTSTCGSTVAASTIYFWAQTSATQLPDRSDLSFSINLVGQTFFEPSNVTVEAANEALVVNWDWPSGLNPAANPSFLGVQLFCQRGQGDQVFPSGTYGAAFMSSATLCPAVARTPPSPLAFANLAPSYLCSTLIPATATSYRINRLQNGIYYGVGVAAVDKYGNLGPIVPTDIVYQAPSASAASPDGGVDGGPHTGGSGGCTLAGGHRPSEAWTAFGLLALGALLLGRTRSRR
jgi:hypothetical protein